MRLLYCSRDYTTHDLRFVRAIVAAGIEVRYLRLESDGLQYLGDPLPSGAQWVQWAGGGTPKAVPLAVADYLPAFTSVVTTLKPDVVHAGPVQSFGLMAALTRAAPTVLVSWGSDVLVDSQRDGWYLWASQTAVRGCQAFFCDSNAVLEAARRLGGGTLPPHLCAPWGPEVLPQARDTASRVSLRRERGWEHSVVAIATRAWHPEYRVPALIDVFAAAAARDPRLRLALLSGGDDAEAVEARITHHGIDHLVYRPGVLPAARMNPLLEAADAYLSLVPSDGTSVSLLEAMAHGLPAVVTRNPGNTEWVTEGKTGYLVDPANPADWVERLLALSADPQAAIRMGEAARSVIQQRANWSTNAAQLVELYRRTAAAVPSNRPAS